MKDRAGTIAEHVGSEAAGAVEGDRPGWELRRRGCDRIVGHGQPVGIGVWEGIVVMRERRGSPRRPQRRGHRSAEPAGADDDEAGGLHGARLSRVRLYR